MSIERVKWAAGTEADFVDWLHHEMHNTMGDRAALQTKWSDNIVQWKARVIGDGVADVPFAGASDIEMPLTARHVDPVYADFMQTIHLPQDFWSVVGKRPDTVDIAKPIQEFLSRVERNYVRMRQINTKAFLDLIIHGTCIYKDLILHDRRKVRSMTDEVVPQLRHQPAVQHVPLEQFIIPAYAYDVNPDAANGAAPWVAQEFYLTPVKLRERSANDAPWLPGYDKTATDYVLSWEEDTLGERPVRETVQQEDQYQPWQHRRITLYEVWARFDVDDDGIEEDIVCIWHHKSRTLLRCLVNPFLHGRRPFSVQPYLPGLGFYGIGMCDLDEWAQLASSRVLNNVIDNTLLANTIMIGAPQGMNIQPDEPIYPYKIWTLGPQETLTGIQMGRSNPGATQLLELFGQWSDQGSGVSELRQGDISNLPSRTPAATTMSMLQEGNKRFDMILGNLREGPLADIGVRMLQNMVQITKTDPRWKAFAVEALGKQDGAAVAQVLDGPVHDIESKFGLTVTATSSQANKEVEKQSLVFLAQLMQQMYPAQMQYAKLLGDPQLQLATAVAAYKGTVELQRRILEAHDIQNPDQYVPQLATGGQPTMQPPMGPGGPVAGAPGMAGGLSGPVPPGGPTAAGPFAQAPAELAAALGVI